MELTAKIFVAGHGGMVGAAIVRTLADRCFSNIVVRSSKELDLRNQYDVNRFFELERPEYVFLAAAKVGGIYANNAYKAEFIYDNIMIEANVIHAAHTFSVKKLLFLGSSCIYPRLAQQPIKEEYLLTGPLEATNEPYAIAKIAGIKMCESFRFQYGCNFISAMPTNLYGQGDNYHIENAHVIPALIRKFHFAKQNNLKEVEIWGTGSPLREFMYVDDLADACVFLMNNYNEPAVINVGSGEEISILDLARIISEVTEFKGGITFNSSMPDGTPRKLMDSARLNALGWLSKTNLKQGLLLTYRYFVNEHQNIGN